MNFFGRLPNGYSPEWGFPYAMSVATNPKIGTEIGNWIYYEDCCLEITDKNENQYHLIAYGWVDKNKCRLTT